MAEACTCHECVRHGCPCVDDDDLTAWRRNSGMQTAEQLRLYLSGLTVPESDAMHIRVWEDRLAAAVIRAERAEAKVERVSDLCEYILSGTGPETPSTDERILARAVLEALK